MLSARVLHHHIFSLDCQTLLLFLLKRIYKRFPNFILNVYYRTIHAMLARYCYRKSSVPLSVRLSVTLMHRERICWSNSKLITGTRIVSLGSSVLGATTSIPRGTPPKFGWNRGRVALLGRKPAISLKWGEIGPRLLLMSNRKSHTRFQLVPKSTTLDDLEGHNALCFKTCGFRSPARKFQWR